MKNKNENIQTNTIMKSSLSNNDKIKVLIKHELFNDITGNTYIMLKMYLKY